MRNFTANSSILYGIVYTEYKKTFKKEGKTFETSLEIFA